MNPILPSGRTTPVCAYIALRERGPYANVSRVRGVGANNPAGPRNTTGMSTARLGANPGGITLQVVPNF